MNITIVRQVPPMPRAAAENRRTFDLLGITCVNILGPSGAGKTALLEAILPRLTAEMNVGVLQGDLASTVDAQCIAALGTPVVQVLTDGEAGLRASQVRRGMAELPLDDLNLLLIENVGGAIVPPHVDLGERVRIAVMSLTGGHQLVAKHPELYRDAAVILLTKFDLREHVEFDLDATVHHLRRVNPRAEIICTDVRNRIGTDRLAGWLLGYVRAQRTGLHHELPSGTAPELVATGAPGG